MLHSFPYPIRAVFSDAELCGQTFLGGEAAIPEGYMGCVAGVDMGKAVLCAGGADGGAQIVPTNLVVGLSPQMDRYTVETDIFDEAGLLAVNQNAIFAFTEDVAEANVEDEIPPTSIVREFIGGNVFYQ